MPLRLEIALRNERFRVPELHRKLLVLEGNVHHSIDGFFQCTPGFNELNLPST